MWCVWFAGQVGGVCIQGTADHAPRLSTDTTPGIINIIVSSSLNISKRRSNRGHHFIIIGSSLHVQQGENDISYMGDHFIVIGSSTHPTEDRFELLQGAPLHHYWSLLTPSTGGGGQIGAPTGGTTSLSFVALDTVNRGQVWAPTVGTTSSLAVLYTSNRE